jgi:hypothetical protein
MMIAWNSAQSNPFWNGGSQKHPKTIKINESPPKNQNQN